MKLILSFNKLGLVALPTGDMPLSKCISFPLFLHFLQVFDGWTILQPTILAEGKENFHRCAIVLSCPRDCGWMREIMQVILNLSLLALL